MIRKAEERDASSLAAVSIEVWVNTYLRDGVSPLFADYVLAEFTAQNFHDAIGDPDLAIWVSENRTGIDGFVKVCSTAAPHWPVARRWKSRRSMFNRGTSRAERAARCCIMRWTIAGASAAKAPG